MKAEHTNVAKTKDQTASEAARIYFLPNLFTAGNLFFGFVAIIRCIKAKYGIDDPILIHEYYRQAVWCLLAAFVCDAFDGRVARMGGQESLFGKEFDSIADVVSFGVAPALMVFFLILSPTEGFEFFRNVGWIIGFIYLLCAGVRLARFNVITHPLIQDPDEKHNTDFVGLPVPVAAGVIASLTLVLVEYDMKHWSVLMPILMLLIAWLMVSQVPYPSFKHINWQTRINPKAFVGLFILLIAVFYFLSQFALVFIFLGYVFYGLSRDLLNRYKNRSKSRA